MQIIIPMSGIGMRFKNEGYQEPKPLIKVDGIPMIQHVVNLFPNEDNITFICNDYHLKNTNMRKILKSFCPNGKIYEVPLENRQGPVHAVSLIFEHINDFEEVIISYCDYGTDWDYKSFLNDLRYNDADGGIACYKGFHPHMLGNDNYAFLKEIENGNLWMDKIQEKKPFTTNRMNEYASNGTYYFKNGTIVKKYFKKLMDLDININNEYYVSMVYNLLREDNLNVRIFEITKMLQWGTPYDLENYNKWSNYFKKIISAQKEIKYDDITTILPLAGRGSRFSKDGYKVPKPLLIVTNKHMIVQAVDSIPKSGNNIFICLKEHIELYKLDKVLKKNYNCDIVSIDKVTNGQAETCKIGLLNTNFNLEKPILISACDNGVYYNFENYNKLINNINIDVIIWTLRNESSSKNNPNMYAWLETDENNCVKSVSCKKYIDGKHNLKTSHVIIGTMFFRKAKYFIEGLDKNYQENIKTNNEYYVDDVINQNIKMGLNIKVFEVENYICWGTPNDYKTFNYWQDFFDCCNWHPYSKVNDITNI